MKKRYLCLLLAFMLCLSMAACGKKAEESAPKPMSVCLVNRTGEQISAVNITPAASDSTILWTTTARLTVAGSMPWRAR